MNFLGVLAYLSRTREFKYLYLIVCMKRTRLKSGLLGSNPTLKVISHGSCFLKT